jgi:hypothetical protein
MMKPGPVPTALTQDTKKIKAVPIDGGLDYSTPRSMAAPGGMLDGFNYEIVDRTGVKRADGYFRWDGAADFSSEDIFYVTASGNSLIPGGSTFPGSMLYTVETETLYGKGYPFGVLLGVHQVDATLFYCFYLRIDARYEPTIGDTIGQLGVSTATWRFKAVTTNPATPYDTTEFPNGYVDNPFPSESTWSARNVTYVWDKFLRKYYVGVGTNSPGRFMNYLGLSNDGEQLPVVASHYFSDRSYVAADYHSVQIQTLTQQIYPGDIIQIGGVGTIPVQVIEATLLGTSTWTGGAGSEALIGYKDVGLDFYGPGGGIYRVPFTSTLNHLAGGNIYLSRAAANVATVGGLLVATKTQGAQLYRSFTEKQAWDEGMVGYITVTGGGTGYTRPPVVALTGTGYGAQAVAIVSGGAVTGIYLTSRGKGYTAAPAVAFTYATGDAGATATATAFLADWRFGGYRAQDTGWQVAFNNGDSASDLLTKVDRRKSQTAQTTALTSATTDVATATNGRPQYAGILSYDGASSTSNLGWFSSGVTTGLLDSANLQADDGSYIGTGLRDVDANYGYRTTSLSLGNMKNMLSSIPIGSIAKGVTATINYDISGAFTGTLVKFQARACLLKFSLSANDPNQVVATRISNFKEVDISSPGVATTGTITLGSTTDLWNLTTASIDSLTDGDVDIGIGVDFYIQRDAGAPAAYNLTFQLDQVTMKISYQSPSITYYFSDGNNTVAADLVSYLINTGSFRTKDALGILQLANLRNTLLRVGGGGSNSIRTGWSMYADSGLTVKIADITADMTYNGLDSRDKIAAASSRYEIIDANFYGDESWRGVYGVSGAGRAFYFDGTYFSRIYAVPLSEPDSGTKDKPRHIANHKFYLVLGYARGSILISQLGKPEEFNPVLGAGSISFGDRVVGIKSLAGEYLAVWCDSSIWGVTGGSVPTFGKRLISPNSGAIEYTIVDIGDSPIFCDTRGITTLNQVKEYGDFLGTRLSSRVSAKLLPRLQLGGSIYDAANASGVVAAYACRAKNQYRVWFKDGMQLVLTFVGKEKEPQFSWLKTLLPNLFTPTTYTNAVGVYPLALSSNVDSNGKERMFFSPDITALKTAFVGFSGKDYASAVFAIDKMWGFDSLAAFDTVVRSVLPIPCEFVTNFFYDDTPIITFSIMKVLTEGQSRNAADVTVTVAREYETSDFRFPQDALLSKSDRVGLDFDYYAFSAISNIKEKGRNMLLKYQNYSSLNHDSSETTYNIPLYPQPPHYIQLLIVYYEEGRIHA